MDTPSALSLLWTRLIYFLVKPYCSTAHWEIKTKSCLWPAATEEVPCPCCHRWPLLRHHFTSFMGSCLLLPKICDGLVWGYQSKPQTQRFYTPYYILPVSCSPDNTMTAYPAHWWGNLSTQHPLWSSRASIPPTLSSLSFLRQNCEENKVFL